MELNQRLTDLQTAALPLGYMLVMVGVGGFEPPCNQLPFQPLIRRRGYTPKVV